MHNVHFILILAGQQYMKITLDSLQCPPKNQTAINHDRKRLGDRNFVG